MIGSFDVAYVFRFDGKVFSEEAKLTAPDGKSFQRLEGAVAIEGNTVVIGVPGQRDDPTDLGSASVFR